MPGQTHVIHLTTVHHPLDPRIYQKEARTLAEAGFDVTVIARGAGVDQLEGVGFIRLPDGGDRWSRLQRQRVAAHEVERIRPRLLHVHDPELLPLARRLKKRTGALVIYDKHETYRGREGWEGRMLRRIEEWAFRWVDHVILAEDAYSDETAGTGVAATVVLNYALPIDRERINEKIKEKGPSPGRINLVYAGTVSRGRGLFHMLDLVRLARSRQVDIHLEIVGICNFPDQRQRAEEEIARDRLSEAVSIQGWSEYAAPRALEAALARADIGLMLAEPEPNYVVSVPTKFYEYLQWELPMVVSDIPLWRAFVERTNTGLVADPNNTPALLQSVLHLVDEELFRTKKEAVREAASAFTWPKMEPRLFDAYEQAGITLPTLS